MRGMSTTASCGSVRVSPMRSTAQRTLEHAYDDLGIELPAATTDAAGRLKTLRRVVLTHPLQRVFGESREVRWSAIFVLGMVALLFVRPVAMSLLSFHRTAAVLAERRAEVRQLSQRNRDLMRLNRYYQTDAYVVEQGRRFGMVRPGEISYVIRDLAHPESTARRRATLTPAPPAGG